MTLIWSKLSQRQQITVITRERTSKSRIPQILQPLLHPPHVEGVVGLVVGADTTLQSKRAIARILQVAVAEEYRIVDAVIVRIRHAEVGEGGDDFEGVAFALDGDGYAKAAGYAVFEPLSLAQLIEHGFGDFRGNIQDAV